MLTVEKLTTLKAYAKLILYIFENGYECNFRAVFTLFFRINRNYFPESWCYNWIKKNFESNWKI